MTIAAKEKTWAEKTHEVLPKLLKTEPLDRLINDGMSASYPKGVRINSLVLDEKYEEKYAEYVALQKSLKKILCGLQLPEAEQSRVEELLEEMDISCYMLADYTAGRMFDVLARFYLRHHLGLDV